MSFSTQDIDSRLRSVEDKIDFVMTQFKVQSQTVLPTLDMNGKPIVKVEVKSLLDIYRALKTGVIEAIEADNENGRQSE